jgi:hypothetical protein
MIATNLIDLEKLLFKTNLEQDWGTLILEILFSCTMAVALLIAFIAMFIVLVIRVAVLWIGFIVSPLVVFAFFDILIPQEKIKNGLSQIVAHAFIPAILGLVLSLTFIVMGQLHLKSTEFSLENSEPLILSGSILSSTHPLFSLLISILVIVLMWIGVFNAMKLSELASPIIEKIDSGARGLAKKIATSPLYINFLPVSSGGRSGHVGLDTMKKHFDKKLNAMTGHGTKSDDIGSEILDGKYALNTKEGKEAAKSFNTIKVNDSGLKMNNNQILNQSETNTLTTALGNNFIKGKNVQDLITRVTKASLKGGQEDWDKMNPSQQASAIAYALNSVAKEKDIKINKEVLFQQAQGMTGSTTNLQKSINNNFSKKIKESDFRKELRKTELLGANASAEQMQKALTKAKELHKDKEFESIQKLIDFLTKPNTDHLKAVKGAAGINP